MMKKVLSILIVMSMLLTLLAGCGAPAASSAAPATDAGSTAKLNVANIVNGNLGDKSFFDSCEVGLKKLATDGKIDYKTFELGATDADQPKWVSTLEELSADGSYDIIICGTWQMNENLAKVAATYPDQKYFIYDSEVAAPNVASITYKQNDLGYLVGTAAAMITTSGMDKTNADKIIGFVGGEDGPVINDFLVGYIEGAKAAVSDVKVDTQYVGNFFDTGRGKELALNMIGKNSDVVWGVAGGAGNGAAEAAAEKNVWFIGVDSDQEATFAVSQPKLAESTVFSGLKNIGDSIVVMVDKYNANTVDWGKTTALGIAEGGVGLTSTGNFAKLSDDIKKAVESATDKVSKGEIKVNSAFDSAFDIKGLRDSVRP